MSGLFRNAESIFKLGLLGFFLFIMWEARTYPARSRLFPELLGGISVLLTMASLIPNFRKLRVEKKKEDVKKPEPSLSDIQREKLRMVQEIEEKNSEDAGFELLEGGERKKRLWQSVIIILISLGIGYLGGFLLTVPFYFITFGVLHGARKQTLKYIIIGLGITIMTYFSFTTLMGVPLLTGLLWDF